MIKDSVLKMSCQGEQFAAFPKSAPSQQGMAIHGNYAFLFYHGASCDVMDLTSREIIGSFHAASYTGDGTGPSANHANQTVFSNAFYEAGDPFPLLYITAGNSGEADEDGYYGRCIVERILMETGLDGRKKFSAQLIQIIIYNDNDWAVDEDIHYTAISPAYERPGWGWPAFFPDAKNNRLYLFSARYRTNGMFRQYDAVNAYIVTAFQLPDPGPAGSAVKLYPVDILDQFTTEYDAEATQGGTFHQGRIFYTFGFGEEGSPDKVRVFDLAERRIIAKLDLQDSVFAKEEIESCGIHEGMLLCNTNSGRIYSLCPLCIFDEPE